MFKSILVVTVTVAQLQGLPEAYESYLDYELVETGQVNEATAKTWGAPDAAGRDYALLQAASREPVYLRFVESEQPDSYSPMTTHGWNAIELLVADPDAVNDRLTRSPFEIIGPPMTSGMLRMPRAPCRPSARVMNCCT
jgi:hypothetical protein